MLAPGVFLLFIGIAAIATGLLLAVVPMSFIWALLVFGILSGVAVYLGQRFYGSRQTNSDQPFLNRRADALIGKTFALSDAIRAGEGAIRVSDTKWRVRGPDMPAGTRVRVTGIEDATVLMVEQA
jgi:membrane protein implicated in regulation of membrane protease activity